MHQRIDSPGSHAAAGSRRAPPGIGRLAAAAGAVALLALVLPALFGALPAAALDQRPSNPTCVAPSLGGSRIRAERAFGSLSFTQPSQIRQHPSDANRFYLSERTGLIKSFSRSGTGLVTALDLRSKLVYTSQVDSSDSEQWGVTSFAFHPSFSTNPYIYVIYNAKPSATARVRSVVARYRANTGGITFDPASETIMLSIEQVAPWHQVGHMQFGPNGRLYVGSGDGGSVRWPAQDWSSRLGKIIEIDVNTSPPAISNYVRGLRNPWRFAFDGNTLWVADVGWNTWEEINRITSGGGNYGWPIYEGPTCMTGDCSTPGLTGPLHAFGHSVGSAVIGGEVYRGSRMPSLAGYYIFGVASSPRLLALVPSSYATRVEIGQLPGGRATGFYRDRGGELFVTDAPGNRVWELFADGSGTGDVVPQALSDTGCVVASNPRQFVSGVIPYAVNQSLWSDGADKSRGFAIPNGTQIGVASDGDFQLPTGSVTGKLFLLDGRPIETRLMMQHAAGTWRGYSYEWGTSDATLVASAGKTKTFTRSDGSRLTWLYPSRAQCLECHTQAAGITLSLETAQLNRNFTYATGKTLNQIDTMRRIGLFNRTLPPASEQPRLANRTAGTFTATQRARAYLHANCSFCHRPNGGGRVPMDLRYYSAVEDMNVCWERPDMGSLGITDAYLLAPGDPARSILAVRPARRDQFAMPPLGTTVVDTQMLTQINAWIRTAGVCD